MLGDAQWAWLEAALRRPADVRLVVSSVQLAATGHGWECWNMLPLERDRFVRLLATVGSETGGRRGNGVIVLSGDRHVGGIYTLNDTDDGGAAPYPLWEATGSAWTHSYKGEQACGATVGGDGGGDDASAFCVAGLADYARCPAVNDEDGPQRVGALVHDENFGTVDLDWEERTVRLSLRRAQHRPGVYTPRAGPYDAGAELQHVTIRMDELTCIPHCTADGSQLDYNWDADGDD